MSCRDITKVGGHTVVEALIALLLLMVALTLTWKTAASQKSAMEKLIWRQSELEAERMLEWVTSSEVTIARPSRDWWTTESVLSLRAFRGQAVPCGTASSSGWLPVRGRGWRRPDASKDSVLLLNANVASAVAKLEERSNAPTPCPVMDGEWREWWRVTTSGRVPVLLRYFERGSYHLEDEVFRYRRGEGGRQPLTASVLDPDHTSFGVAGSFLSVSFRPSVRPWSQGTVPDGGWSRVIRGAR